MKMKSVLLLVFILGVPAVAADLQIDSFDDISSWSGDGLVQGTAPGDPVHEGSGSMVCDYTPYPGVDNLYISKTVSLDLSPSVIGASEAAISLWMWVGKESVTARLHTIKFATSYYNSEFEYVMQPWNRTWDIGWNHVVIRQSDFAESSTTTVTPTWSNITWMQIYTTCYNDTSPTDVVFDDLRLVEYMPPAADLIESFDNISSLGLSIYPDNGWVVQDNLEYVEGTGSMRIEFEDNYPGDPADNIYINWYPSGGVDLSPSVIGVSDAAISIWLWIGKESVTARLHSIKFATSYYNSEFEYVLSNTTYDIGWNQVIIPQEDFHESSTTTVTPDWSDITWIQIQATCANDSTPTDVLFDNLRLVEYVPPPPPPPPGQIGQIDSFDDISDWNVSPTGVMAQGTVAGGDPVKESTGSLIADYTPYSSDFYTFSKDISPYLDLAQTAAIDATINLWMWTGKTTPTARIDYITFETSAGNDFSYAVDTGNSTYPVGWNQLIMPMSDFTVTGSPDWSNITRIEFTTTSNPDTTPTDVVFDNLRVIESTSPPAGQIETFDDISNVMSVYPEKGWAVQDEQEYTEGTGALRVEYADNYAGDPTDDFQISWYTAPLDLNPSTIGTSEASISLWIWSGKESVTSRPHSITFATEYGTHEFEYVTPSLATYDIGWNQLVIPQSAFTATGSPDWSNITWIAVNTTCTPDTTPTDLIIDNLRLVENKCNIMDVDGDCEFTLSDLALMLGCWLVDCISSPAVAPRKPALWSASCVVSTSKLRYESTQNSRVFSGTLSMRPVVFFRAATRS